jgi:hypothetical protein
MTFLSGTTVTFGPLNLITPGSHAIQACLAWSSSALTYKYEHVVTASNTGITVPGLLSGNLCLGPNGRIHGVGRQHFT